MDNGAPIYFNTRSILLLSLLGLLVYLVSPLNSLPRKEREGLLLVYPALVLVYWQMFQVRLLSLNPHVHFYLDSSAVPAWKTNSFMCLGLGAAFSLAILWLPGLARRSYGGLFLAGYLWLITGILFFRTPMPGVLRL